VVVRNLVKREQRDLQEVVGLGSDVDVFSFDPLEGSSLISTEKRIEGVSYHRHRTILSTEKRKCHSKKRSEFG
jgi:hypothetical protein